MKAYRFPGVASFEDNEISRQLFFGRHEDGNKLLHIILSESLTVLFSKSGYGKTSLLQANVFQKLREKNFYPILIRLNQKELSPLNIVKARLQTINESEPYDIISSEAPDMKSFLDKLEIWSMEDKLFTPILVFDQFEEIFTLDHNIRHINVFFSELSEVVHATSEKGTGVKIVISIREDFLGRLEELSSKIPFIFTNRFRLEPLKKTNAEDAISKPSSIKVDNIQFESPCFIFSNEAREELLNFLSLKLRAGNLTTSDEIEPIQLQIICRELEERVIEGKITSGNGVSIIQVEDLGGRDGMKDMLGNFYQKQLNNLTEDLQIDFPQLQAVRNIIETELIAGRRRVPLDYDSIINKKDVSKEAIDLLIKNKLLKIESHQNNSLVEISHDTLVDPIIKSFDKRRAEEMLKNKQIELEINKKKLRRARTSLAIVSFLLVACFVLGFLLFNTYKKKQRKIKYG